MGYMQCTHNNGIDCIYLTISLSLSLSIKYAVYSQQRNRYCSCIYLKISLSLSLSMQCTHNNGIDGVRAST